jgi:hypothetical protein
LTIAPSIDCHSQAIPSSSSYSASPASQILSNTPALSHFLKYAWTLDALPNFSLGKAFHWIPVRSTNTIASKTFLGSIGLRPPPAFLWYFLFRGRTLSGISGSTKPQNFSETSQDLDFPATSTPPAF